MSTERSSLLGLNRSGIWNSKMIFRAGAIFVAAGMAAGAFGSHGLKNKPGMTPDKLSNWQLASQYSIYNGLGLMLVGMHPRFATSRFAGPAIAAGGLLFSSSVYALTLDRDRFKFLGPVTPLGGLLMITGYLSLLF